MTLGLADRQGNLLDDVSASATRRSTSTRSTPFLHRERDLLFPDEVFADLFDATGPAVGAALGRGRGDGAPAPGRPVGPRGGRALQLRRPLALRGRRRRLRHRRWTTSPTRCSSTCASACGARSAPNRIFEVALDAAKQAGLVGARRVLDSTPLYDAVATMDTVTLIRSAIRGLLKVADAELRGRAARGADERATTTPARRQAPDRLGRRRRPRGAGRLPGQRRLCLPRCSSTDRELDAAWPRPPSCSPPWSARTSRRATTASSASPAKWPRTG